MAKKKNQSKKHHFKYTEAPTESDITQARADGTKVTEKSAANTVRPNQDSQRDFSYVSRDLKRIAILALSLVVLEVGLAYIFNHTGLGSIVDNFIKL
jgi:hypothetical protein